MQGRGFLGWGGEIGREAFDWARAELNKVKLLKWSHSQAPRLLTATQQQQSCCLFVFIFFFFWKLSGLKVVLVL